MENWQEILDFDHYSVSNRGRVRNDKTQRIMRQVVNQRGFVYVGMMKRGRQHKASVPVLVARAFLPPHPNETFTSPIHLDGDRFNNDVDNLMWRPVGFAIEYYRQFAYPKYGITVPLEEVKTGEIFPDSRAVAQTFGLLEKEIVLAVTNRTYVWPTYQMFRFAL